jgi:hypothetical protein
VSWLAHVGLSTAKVEGKGFTQLANAGDAAEAGQLLVRSEGDDIAPRAIRDIARHPDGSAVGLRDGENIRRYCPGKAGCATRRDSAGLIRDGR